MKQYTGDCWEWDGAKSSAGYPQIRLDNTCFYLHRIIYEQTVSPIPDKYQIDHLCRNRGCINPEHLEAVTQRENILRGSGWSGRKARQTHCKYGHELTTNNLTQYGIKTGRRLCKICKSNKNKVYNSKRKAILV
ncbi:MAG TPA: HNH endonuclease signature motif containing protein [Candidatus Saccharibacteria bacterium]|nr:HNH endonuclease signature motif containing protein [Candidatus Saccharibacteria bacterium]